MRTGGGKRHFREAGTAAAKSSAEDDAATGSPSEGASGSGEEAKGPAGFEAPSSSAVDKLMSGETGDRLTKAMRDVIELRAARDALEEEGASVRLTEQAAKERAESLEVLQQRMREVEEAEKGLAKARAQTADLKAVLNLEEERISSVKAAIAGGAAAGTCALPLAALGGSSPLALASAAACGSLFALTYRYAMSSSPDNPQLKSGVVLAFALTRWLSALDLEHVNSLDQVLALPFSDKGVPYLAQSLLLFGFVSVALEYGFRTGLLSLFGEAKE